MRVLVRRVRSADVKVDNIPKGMIKRGMVVYLGVSRNDSDKDLEWMVKKVLGLRIFDDSNGAMNLPISPHFGILVISQFTLFGNVGKGTRPSFNQAASPVVGRAYFDRFILSLKNNFNGVVEQGVFGAEMQIMTVEDGPVNIWIDSQMKKY